MPKETMNSQLSVRLPEDLCRGLADAARRLRLRRSDIVRLALEKYLHESVMQEDVAPYDRVKHLVGSVSSGIPDMGTAHREHLVKRMRRNG
jgi:hypothetical protein